MRFPNMALAAVAGLGLTFFPLAYAATTAAPKTPDVGQAAAEYVKQIEKAPVCTLEEGSTDSYSCSALSFGAPFSFRCMTTATDGSLVCAVPLLPQVEGTAVGTGTDTRPHSAPLPSAPATPTGK
jgi:hypothetical protein